MDVTPQDEQVVIEVRRTRLFNGHGKRVPFSWLYQCAGPDGRRFDNRSIVELRAVLRRNYSDVVLTELWK